MAEYTSLLIRELRVRTKYLPKNTLRSVYFGGGTPSLLPMDHMVSLIEEIGQLGFEISRETEVTIEINPGTISTESLDQYLAAGVNRFSVGAQSFNDKYLKACGREHSAKQSDESLQFLKARGCNFSVDLLFGLPDQRRADLALDLKRLISYEPKHVSLYNLTIPPQHRMNHNRASDEEQATMFDDIESSLLSIGLKRYELSNFSKPGHESKHNQLYWSDQGYLGIGISAHSYLPNVADSPFGARFWNSRKSEDYRSQILKLSEVNSKIILDGYPETQIEHLKKHEAMTDYCHTHLRTVRGIDLENFKRKFGENALILLKRRVDRALSNGWLQAQSDQIRLSSADWPIANQIFLEFTFLSEDIDT